MEADPAGVGHGDHGVGAPILEVLHGVLGGAVGGPQVYVLGPHRYLYRTLGGLEQGDGPEIGLGDISGGLCRVQGHRAHERRHPRGGRVLVDLGGRSGLHDAARVHHRHPVAQNQCLLPVVGHEHRGHLRIPQQLAHLGAHLAPQGGVQVGEGLVQQQDRGLGGQCPGQRHPLLLAAGKGVGGAALHTRQVYQIQRLGHLGGPLAAGDPVAHVAGHIQVGEQRPVLEHHAHMAVLGPNPGAAAVHCGSVQADLPLIGPLQPGDEPQQGGLAAPARSQKRQHLAGVQCHIEVVQHFRGTERLVHALDGQQRRGGFGD